MANLLDMMSDEDRKIAEEAYAKRKAGDTSYRKSMTIPSDVYLVAELGYYYGWNAIEAVKRGYVESFQVKVKDGVRTEERTKIPLNMDEVNILVEAARKVKYSAVVDAARGTQVAVTSSLSKAPKKTFTDGMKPYTEGAKP